MCNESDGAKIYSTIQSMQGTLNLFTNMKFKASKTWFSWTKIQYRYLNRNSNLKFFYVL